MKKTNDLSIDTEKTKQFLSDFIREKVSGAGFSKAVIGLSGGIDSSLSGYLAVEALGAENVMAVRMPYKTSSPESLEHANLVIDNLGMNNMTVPITDMVDPLFERFPDADHIRRGNAMARARMIVLYDQSQAFDGLVVGTGNKTEFLLGYTTLYGDAACAFNPLGDLYKTQVRQLSRAMGVPEVIITKPPSADLWVDQTDEGELGFTYDEVDQLLFLLVNERHAPDECIAAGYSEQFVKAVINLIRKNSFKRVVPPIAKLDDRELSEDFLSFGEWGR
jgi:NAD+ synthase